MLRPGGHFSLAVWDDMEENRLIKTVLEAFSRRLAAELLPPFERLCAGAAAALVGIKSRTLATCCRDSGEGRNH